jgi:hypothetical protein
VITLKNFAKSACFMTTAAQKQSHRSGASTSSGEIKEAKTVTLDEDDVEKASLRATEKARFAHCFGEMSLM